MRSFVNRKFFALVLLLGAALPASVVAQTPVLQGGVAENRSQSPSLDELQWLKAVRNQGRDPESAALLNCEHLLSNATLAWQLIPDNVADCDAVRDTLSPQQPIRDAARNCWQLVAEAGTHLSHAHDEYRLMDQLRHSPKSSVHRERGDRYQQQAVQVLAKLSPCLRKLQEVEGSIRLRLEQRVQAANPAPGNDTFSGGTNRPAPIMGTTPTGETGSRGGDRPLASGTKSEFPCEDPPAGTRGEVVRGLPGGVSCELRGNDDLWCRQRSAHSGNPNLGTNPAWDMKPVGVRVTADCRFIVDRPADGSGLPPLASGNPPSAGLLVPPDRCCVGDDGVSACPTTNPLLLAGRNRLDALRRLGRCPSGGIEPGVRGVALPKPAGDAGNWAAGLIAGTTQCMQLSAAMAARIAGHLQRWDFPSVERELGLTGARDRPAGQREVPVIEHRMLTLTLQAMQGDLLRQRLGAFSDHPTAYPRITDYDSGRIAGEHLCAYAGAASAQKLIAPVAGLASRIAKGSARAGASRASNLIQQLKQRAQQQGGRALSVAEVTRIGEALADGTRVNADAMSRSGTPLRDAAAGNALQVEGALQGRLAHTSVELPSAAGGSAAVRLGEFRGGGSFGATYDLLDAASQPTGNVIKIVYQTRAYPSNLLRQPGVVPNMGGDSVGRQIRGSNLLRQAGIETPTIHEYHAAAQPGGLSHVVMQKIDLSLPQFDSWNGNRFPLAAKRQAVIDLHDRIGGSGLLAFDTAPRNVYFKRDAGGRVQAGIWDADFIDRAGTRLDPASDTYRTAALHGSAAANVETAPAKMGLLYEIDYNNPAQAMKLIRQIQYGF